MLSVEEAQDRVLAHVQTLPSQQVGLVEACNRVLAQDIFANHSQPPFPASAMDGYAVRWADIAILPADLSIIGEAAAGARFHGTCGAGQAVRIFTGAPVPEGADTVVVQEDVQADGVGPVRILARPDRLGGHIRPAGIDFESGDLLVRKGRWLTERDIALAASGNHATVQVANRPRVAILTSGDELRLPGSALGPDNIVASNSLALSLMLRAAGAEVIDLGIVPDQLDQLTEALEQAFAADLVVTIGGASVGDKDLTQAALQAAGARLAFWKIAMRPGKPLMMADVTRRDRTIPVLGLPGNPVSALVCARLFVLPLVRAFQGMAATDCLPERHAGLLTVPLPANGPRAHFMRARVHEEDGQMWVTPFPDQDSSLLTVLAAANALAIRDVEAPPADAASPIHYIWLSLP
jgi:molybdopterin molybdotransferase